MFIKVNLKQLTKDNLFYSLRNMFNLDWHNFLNTATDYLYNKLLLIRDRNLFLTNHTSQKISLDHLFNNLIDDLGNKIITGSPVYCETTGNLPLFYFFTFNERDTGLVPQNVKAFYNFNNQVVQYNPLNAYSWTDAEIYGINNSILQENEDLSWMFTDDDTTSGGYTIYVDSVDFIGLIGYDSNNNAIYSNGSKLDIINKYAAQYTVAGVNYKIERQ